MSDNHIPTVVIDITGGVAQWAIGDGPVHLIVVDYDRDVDPSDQITIGDRRAIAYYEYVQPKPERVAVFVEALEEG